MGAGTIIENNIRSATSSFWDKVPTIQAKSWLDFDLSKYNKSFVNLAVAVGVIALAKTSISALSYGINLASKAAQKIPTSKELHQKYGYHSWAVISDCAGNQEYSKLLAKNGFHLILMGKEQDVEITKAQLGQLVNEVKVQTILVDWKIEEGNLKFYQQVMEKLKEFDISFLVLPKLLQVKEKIPTHIEIVQPFQHIYLLARYFGDKMKWRSYMSAMIFPSHEDYESVTEFNGITKCLIAGNDAFGRILNFELRGSMEVVVARGSAENALKGLGREKITH